MIVYVYRILRGGDEALWTSFTAGGGVEITNETDGPDIANSAWPGSITLNDSANDVLDRSCRAEILAYGELSVTHSSATFDSQAIRQNLSIVSIKQ